MQNSFARINSGMIDADFVILCQDCDKRLIFKTVDSDNIRVLAVYMGIVSTSDIAKHGLVFIPDCHDGTIRHEGGKQGIIVWSFKLCFVARLQIIEIQIPGIVQTQNAVPVRAHFTFLIGNKVFLIPCFVHGFKVVNPSRASLLIAAYFRNHP